MFNKKNLNKIEYSQVIPFNQSKHLNLIIKKDVLYTENEICNLLTEIIQLHSSETANHIKRVGEYSYQLALLAGIDKAEAKIIRKAAPFHDFGKVVIPDEILNKPEKLTAEEYVIMQNHAAYGAKILNHLNKQHLKTNNLFNIAAIISEQHHEKYNGTGYPCRLKEKDIHISARIVMIVDIFDALLSARIYKKSWEINKVISYFHKNSGIFFDPEFVTIFIENVNVFLEIRKQHPD